MKMFGNILIVCVVLNIATCVKGDDNICNKIEGKLQELATKPGFRVNFRYEFLSSDQFLSFEKTLYREATGTTIKEKVQNHAINRVRAMYMYSKEAATLVKKIMEAKNVGKLDKDEWLGLSRKRGVLFQDSSVSNNHNREDNGEEYYQIECGNQREPSMWQCLNNLEKGNKFYHEALHMISFSIFSEKDIAVVRRPEIKDLFCNLAIMNAYTEDFLKIVNRNQDQTIDQWQRMIAKQLLADPEKFEATTYTYDKFFKEYSGTLVNMLIRDTLEERTADNVYVRISNEVINAVRKADKTTVSATMFETEFEDIPEEWKRAVNMRKRKMGDQKNF